MVVATRLARRDALLGAVSAAQLVVGVFGLGVARKRHHAFSLPFLRGKETDLAALVVGGLGALMVAGYLGEALGRRRLRPAHYDSLETPVVALGLGLAATMAALGLHRAGCGSRRRDL